MPFDVPTTPDQVSAEASHAPLGYPTVTPLGYSYSIGQAIFHQPNLPSDPTDSTLPDRSLWIGFIDAISGQLTDRSTWTPQDYASAIARIQGDPAALANLRQVFGVYKSNGPLPVDVQTNNGPSQGVGWKGEDGIIAERHVYFYDDQRNYGQSGASAVYSGMSDHSALYLQISGYSTSTNSWVLPRPMLGQQATGWRWEGGGKWKAVFSSAQFIRDNAQAIGNWALVIMSAVVTIATFGGASPILIAALGIAVATIKATMTGDTRQLWSATMALGSQVLKMTSADINLLTSKSPELAVFAQDVAKPFAKFADIIQKDPTFQSIAQTYNALEANIQGAQRLSQTLPLVNQDFWSKVAIPVGPIQSAGAHFLLQVKSAALSELQDIYAQAPWYAKGVVEYAAPVRAAEIQQGIPVFAKGPKQIVLPRPGGGNPGDSFRTRVQRMSEAQAPQTTPMGNPLMMSKFS